MRAVKAGILHLSFNRMTIVFKHCFKLLCACFEARQKQKNKTAIVRNMMFQTGEPVQCLCHIITLSTIMKKGSWWEQSHNALWWAHYKIKHQRWLWNKVYDFVFNMSKCVIFCLFTLEANTKWPVTNNLLQNLTVPGQTAQHRPYKTWMYCLWRHP